MENKRKLFKLYEEMLSKNRIYKKDGARLLGTSDYTYYENRKMKSSRIMILKFIMLFLLCSKYMSKKHFKKVIEVMEDIENWNEKGLRQLEK